MRRAFTMIELLVVIVIIAVIPAITLPALASARQHTLRIVCASNMKQIDLARHTYANDNEGRMPSLNPPQSIRSAAPVDTVDATPDKLLVVDWSHFGSGTRILNQGKVTGVMYGVSLLYFRQSIVGDNRLVIDGHLERAMPDQTGRNGEHLNSGPRYSHYSNLRPYYMVGTQVLPLRP